MKFFGIPFYFIGLENRLDLFEITNDVIGGIFLFLTPGAVKETGFQTVLAAAFYVRGEGVADDHDL